MPRVWPLVSQISMLKPWGADSCIENVCAEAFQLHVGITEIPVRIFSATHTSTTVQISLLISANDLQQCILHTDPTSARIPLSYKRQPAYMSFQISDSTVHLTPRYETC